MKIVIFPSKKTPKTFFKKNKQRSVGKTKEPETAMSKPRSVPAGPEGAPARRRTPFNTQPKSKKKKRNFRHSKNPGERNRRGVVNGRKDHHTCHLVVLALKKKEEEERQHAVSPVASRSSGNLLVKINDKASQTPTRETRTGNG
jgi:phage protein D